MVMVAAGWLVMVLSAGRVLVLPSCCPDGARMVPAGRGGVLISICFAKVPQPAPNLSHTKAQNI